VGFTDGSGVAVGATKCSTAEFSEASEILSKYDDFAAGLICPEGNPSLLDLKLTVRPAQVQCGGSSEASEGTTCYDDPSDIQAFLNNKILVTKIFYKKMNFDYDGSDETSVWYFEEATTGQYVLDFS